MQINKKDLKIYLQKNKNMFSPKIDGLSDIVSAVSLFATLWFSNIEYIFWHKLLYIISLVVFSIGVYKLCSGFRKISLNRAFNEICELDETSAYRMNLIVIKDSGQDGKYLLCYNKTWRCYLFPCHEDSSNNDNLEQVKKRVEDDLRLSDGDLDIKFVDNFIECKYNYDKKFCTKYNFHFYLVELKTNKISNNKNQRIKYAGRFFRWMTLDEMISNHQIQKKNRKVVEYVRNHIDLS